MAKVLDNSLHHRRLTPPEYLGRPSLDVLLTWNCKHLANPNKFGHIDLVNDELGLTTPLLTTPLNYLSEDDSNGD